MGEFAVSIEHSEAKSVSASGGFAPLDSAGGSAPQTPGIGRACHGPPLPNPKYATAY